MAIQSISPNHPYLLINQGANNRYVKITLEGTVSNKDAIGSWINVYANGTASHQYTHCGENYLGQNSQHLIFGIGATSLVDSITVKYPSGHIDSYYDLQANSHQYFTEGETYSTHINTPNGLSFCSADSIFLTADIHASYLWNTGDTTQSIWANTDGEYSVIGQNEFGITAQDIITLVEFPTPSISSLLTMPLCAGDSTGSIELLNQTQINPAIVIWSHDDSGNIIDSLQSGEYTYTYEDVNGCVSSGTVSLIDPPAMQFFATSTPEVSGNADGTITISIFGGTAPFEIYFDNELVTFPLSGLETGSYVFTIIDGNGCTEQITVDVQSVLDITNIDFNEIAVFPNPVTNHFKIESEGTHPFH